MMVPAAKAGYARSRLHFARKSAVIDMCPVDIAAQVVKRLIDRLGTGPASHENVTAVRTCPEPEQRGIVAPLTGKASPTILEVA